MLMHSHCVPLGTCLFLLVVPHAPAEDPPTLDLKPLRDEIQKLVVKQYPKATVTMKDQTIRIEFNLRTFMIHEPLLTGEWQDAHEESGPQKGGVLALIELRSGQYGGQAAVPQAFDKRYFVHYLMAPYSKKLDHHLYVHLKCPHDAPKEFLKDFARLMEGFDRYVERAGK